MTIAEVLQQAKAVLIERELDQNIAEIILETRLFFDAFATVDND